MGKYRDHRDPRRQGHGDDDFSSFSPTSEPGYFRRVQTTATESVEVEVIWFNASKGFGFVKLADGTEAYLPLRALEAVGTLNAAAGSRLKVTIEKGQKGHQVAQVLEISSQITHEGGQAGAPTVAQREGEGTVKWYNPDKGFGFIAPDNGEKDVFIHASTLTRSGLSVLQEGQKVLIECGPGKKGLEVKNIRLA